jgi:hypothetical protein
MSRDRKRAKRAVLSSVQCWREAGCSCKPSLSPARDTWCGGETRGEGAQSAERVRRVLSKTNAMATELLATAHRTRNDQRDRTRIWHAQGPLFGWRSHTGRLRQRANWPRVRGLRRQRPMRGRERRVDPKPTGARTQRRRARAVAVAAGGGTSANPGQGPGRWGGLWP